MLPRAKQTGYLFGLVVTLQGMILANRIVHRIKRVFTGDLDAFLKRCRGVIHVGANTGQERVRYESFGLRVLWIEPNPEVFDTLKRNVALYSRQKALNYLITDTDGQEYSFHLANNEGESSSILELGQHSEIWPEVCYTGTIKLTGVTLPSLLRQEQINASDYDALVLDTQGSELTILRGAVALLPAFSYVRLEAPTFEPYKGCAKLSEIDEFMTQTGFQKHRQFQFAKCPSGGAYYEVVYKRRL